MISTKEMRKLEDKSETLGVTKLELMENAGKGIFTVLNERFDLRKKKILIVCYHGNNGGDGFVAARYLSNICEVDVLFVGDETKFRKEGEFNYQKIINQKSIKILKNINQTKNKHDIIIDALLGTGITGDIKEPIANVIDRFNNSKAFKVSVDVPTGINPDTGEKSNKFIKADLIITFHDIKKGLLDLKDKTVIVDIGIPKELIKG